ncbi:MAG: aminoacyl-tRNA hydrolase [Gemmatimonadaceae bacterium]
MKLLVGLGNPGREYENTRHNVGWWVLDHLADVWHFDGWRKDGDALTSTGVAAGTKVRLCKPLTFMNLSGAVLRPYLRRPFWAAKTDLLVVVDDVALSIGRLRLRANGSAGGHNGLKSIQGALGGNEYARMRIGIKPLDERREIGDLADFVLDKFDKHERAAVLDLMPRLATATELWIREGIDETMNTYNGDR